MQKEAHFSGKKCFVLREETEWNELKKTHTVKLIGTNIINIKKNDTFLKKKISKSKIFGDGKSTIKIANLVNKILDK